MEPSFQQKGKLAEEPFHRGFCETLPFIWVSGESEGGEVALLKGRLRNGCWVLMEQTPLGKEVKTQPESTLHSGGRGQNVLEPTGGEAWRGKGLVRRALRAPLQSPSAHPGGSLPTLLHTAASPCISLPEGFCWLQEGFCWLQEGAWPAYKISQSAGELQMRPSASEG